MSVPESRVRKSNRQHVPNPIYQQGITQLKNVLRPSDTGKHNKDQKKEQ